MSAKNISSKVNIPANKKNTYSLHHILGIFKAGLSQPHMVARMIMLVISIETLGVGVANLKMVGWGTDPMSTLTFGIASKTGISMGTWQLLLNIVMFIPVIIFMLDIIGVGTILNMTLIGYTANFVLWFARPYLPEGGLSMPAKILLFLASMVLFLLAAAFYTVANLGLAPYDAIPMLISRKTNRFSFRTIRMTWDISYMVLGLLFGSTVGLTTILLAFCMGPVISAIVKRIDPLLNR